MNSQETFLQKSKIIPGNLVVDGMEVCLNYLLQHSTHRGSISHLFDIQCPQMQTHRDHLILEKIVQFSIYE